ncbi:unnamed protein product [Calypogeia fissa]
MESAGAVVVSHGAANAGKTVSPEELERIKAFRRPDVITPYIFKKNPFTEKATAEAYLWAQNAPGLLDVYHTPRELEKFLKFNIGDFAMVGFADCGEEEATWLLKYSLWITIIDDQMDNHPTHFRSPEKSMMRFLELNLMLMWSFPDDEQLYNTFVKFLDVDEVVDRAQALHYVHSKLDEARLKPGTIYDPPEAHPLCKAFRDIWTELCEKMPADFLRRWALVFQYQNLRIFMETRNRKHNTIPSADEHIFNRRDSIAAKTGLVLVDFLDKVHIPDEIFYCPEMQRIFNAFLDIIVFVNDIWSFKKEAVLGEVNNLVIILSKEQDCSYTEAGEKIGKMILDSIAEMEKAIGDLEKVTPPEYQHAVSRYILATRNLARYIGLWHQENSVRYAQNV